MNNNIVYTIGYAGFNNRKDFIKKLMKKGINCVIDVRSQPYSAHYSDYNADGLRVALKKENIEYRNYARSFGARQLNKAYYSEEGYLSFKKFSSSEEFTSGMEEINKGMEKGYVFALMCAEKDPINCHRNIMVAREFFKKGYIVINLWPEAEDENQKELEERLLKKYSLDHYEPNLFTNETYEEYRKIILDEAYEIRNKEIGFRMEEDS